MRCIREEPIIDVDNGCRFFSNFDNLVSQSAFVNLSEYKKLENIWDKAVKSGKKVSVDLEIKYNENSNRPSEFIVKFTLDGRNYKKSIKN